MSKQAILAKIGVVVIFLTILVFSLIVPGYDHLSQTISELNSKTAPYRIEFNTFLTIGFILILPFCFQLSASKEVFLALSGALTILAILIVLAMTWFVPMDATEGIRTTSDDAHNAMISVAVSLILLSQISKLIAFEKLNKKREFKIVLIMFLLALVFGLLSLYANLNMLELINIAERGWMIVFFGLFIYFARTYRFKERNCLRSLIFLFYKN